MSRFEDVLPALRAGKKVRRQLPGWLQMEPGGRVVTETGRDWNPSDRAFVSEDWEIVKEEPKPGDRVFIDYKYGSRVNGILEEGYAYVPAPFGGTIRMNRIRVGHVGTGDVIYCAERGEGLGQWRPVE